MKKLRELRGLGPKSEQMLVEAGVSTVTELKELGAVGAFLKVKQHTGSTPSLNLLYALVGAIEDKSWQHVAKTQKEALIMALEGLEELDKLFDENRAGQP